MFNTYNPSKSYYNQMGYSEDVLERFWSKVDVKKFDDGTDDLNSCMEWNSSKHKGYGRFHLNQKSFSSHRFIWECYNGPISKGLYVLHKCNNPSCVNPYHLWTSNSKLIEKNVRNILVNINNCTYTNLSQISKIHNISEVTIRKILNGKLWKHVSTQVCKDLNCGLITIKKKII